MSVLYAITKTVIIARTFKNLTKAASTLIVPVLLAALAVQVSYSQEQKLNKSSVKDPGAVVQITKNTSGGYSYRIQNGEHLVVSEDFTPASEIDSKDRARVEGVANMALEIYKQSPHMSAEQILAEKQYQLNKANQASRGQSGGINQNTLATCSFTGTLEAGDTQLFGRIFRDGIIPTCAATKICPGAFDAAAYNYDTHTINNPTGSTACVTVSAVSTNGQQVHVNAYLNTHNPAAICQNYIADQGLSSVGAAPQAFSFNIPAGQSAVLVILNPINGTTTTPYNITVDNCPTLPCAPIVITGQPADVTACALTNASFTVTAGPAGVSYNWQEDRGSGFVYLTNGGQYSGATTATLTVSNLTVANSGWRYRAVVTCSGGGLPEISDDALLTVLPAPNQPNLTPTSAAICPGGAVQLQTSASTTMFTSGTVNVPIPDNSAVGANSGITVSGIPGPVSGVIVNFNITHTWDGDLTINLTAPNGNTINLVRFRGGSGDNFTNTTISSNSSVSLATGAAPFTGTFAPDAVNAVGATGFVSNTTVFSNLFSVGDGTWRLSARDEAGADVGTIVNWSLGLQTGAPPAVIWSPATGLFLDAGLTTPYVAGTLQQTVWASPAVTTTYTVNANNGSCNSGPASVTVTVNQPPSITTQPSTNGNTCVGDNKTFTVAAVGTGLTYQWQVNTGSGFVNLAEARPYSGTTTPTLTITGSPTSLNGFIYRAVVSGTCTPAANSNSVTLTVNPLPTVNVSPQNICAPVSLTATGANTYAWSPTLGLSSATGATVTATPSVNTIYTVTGTTTATGCTNIASVTVLGLPKAPTITPPAATICLGGSQLLTVSSSDSYTNTAPISIPSSGIATPYPSNINVAGLATSGVSVKSVTITNFSHTWPDDVDIVLQSPTGVNVILMSDAGGSAIVTNRTWTFDDSAPTLMADAAANATGTYRPTNYGTGDTWPAPGPGAFNQATPTLSLFGTGNHNGTWRLFVVDQFAGDLGAINSGWSITFNSPGATVFSPTTGLFTNAGLTIPYTGTAVSQVYASPAVTTTYNATGVATADGVTSFSGKGPLQIPGVGSSGVSTRYPGTISVSGIPTNATVKSVTLGGINHTFPDDVDIILQSPTGVNVVLMSDAGGSADLTGETYVFDDAAASLLADGALNPSGTYRPTNFLTTDDWPAPGPGTLTQATPTLASFTGDPNGEWKIFIADDAGGDIGFITNFSITFNTPVTSCVGPATAVTITVHPPITITAHPQNRTACAGDNVTFSVTATGFIQTYQWQVSTGGGPFVNTGTNSPNLTVNGVTTAMSGNRYRVLVSNVGCGATTSNFATLTVNPLPTVQLTVAPFTQLRPGMTTTLTVSSTPAAASFNWMVNGTSVPSITTNTYVADAFHLGTYNVEVTDVNGCRNTTNSVTLTALATSNVFIYPNPTTTGVFNVTYYTPIPNWPVTITVIDMKGRRHEARSAISTSPYTQHVFDVGKLGAGVYVIEFRNPSGELLDAGRVVVIR